MYGLLLISAVLFSVQFFFNQKFRVARGEGLPPTLVFLTYSNAANFLILLVLNGFSLSWSWIAFGCAALYAAACLGYTYFALKAFGSGDLSAFSLFAMLGGMLLPAVYGIAFADEPITWSKLLCLAAIIAALMLGVDQRLQKRNLLYYMAVFLFNGLVGVVAKFHQSLPQAVDSYSFLMLNCGTSVAVCVLWHLCLTKKIPRVSWKECFLTSSYAACNGVGNLLSLVALMALPASVQYPFITGGCIFFSAVVGRLAGERFTWKKGLAVGISVLATALLAI